MSLDANKSKSELDVLIGIYDALSDVRSKVAENAAKHQMSAQHIAKLEQKLDGIHQKIEALTISEAKTSMKFGIITFVATLLSVTGINYALSDAESRVVGLPPHKYEVLKDDGLVVSDD